jgi:phage-related holin
MKTSLLATILSVSTLAAFVCSYFFNLTLENAEQYLALVSVVFVDGFFGIWSGSKREGFKTFKALKVLKTLFTWIVLLTIVLLVEEGFKGVFFLSETIIAPFVIFQLVSILKNASMVGAIPQSLLTDILEKIDNHKNTNTES